MLFNDLNDYSPREIRNRLVQQVRADFPDWDLTQELKDQYAIVTPDSAMDKPLRQMKQLVGIPILLEITPKGLDMAQNRISCWFRLDVSHKEDPRILIIVAGKHPEPILDSEAIKTWIEEQIAQLVLKQLS